MVGRDLVADVEPTRCSDGRWSARIDAGWSFLTPSGGVLMGAALAAARAELAAPELCPRSLTAVFCAPVPSGPVELRPRVLRRGGAAAQVQVELQAEGATELGLSALAVFTRERAGLSQRGRAFPEVPPPEDCPPLFDAGAPGALLPFFDQLELRLALGHRWWREGWAPGAPRTARWVRFRHPHLRDGGLPAEVLPAVIDLMPPAISEGLGPGHRPPFAPSLDLTVHFLDVARTEWLLLDAQARWVEGGVAQAELQVWDADQRPVAHGVQTMILRRPPRRSGGRETP